MKINCDFFSDRRKNRHERQLKWHLKFKFYARIGHGDCRIFETVLARRRWVEKVNTFGRGWVDIYEWEYRAIDSENNPNDGWAK